MRVGALLGWGNSSARCGETSYEVFVRLMWSLCFLLPMNSCFLPWGTILSLVHSSKPYQSWILNQWISFSNKAPRKTTPPHLSQLASTDLKREHLWCTSTHTMRWRLSWTASLISRMRVDRRCTLQREMYSTVSSCFLSISIGWDIRIWWKEIHLGCCGNGRRKQIWSSAHPDGIFSPQRQ